MNSPWKYILAVLLLAQVCLAHTVDCQIDRGTAVVITVRLGDDDASYSEYEVFAPSENETPFQLGRTDAKGRLAFLPSETGTWRVKVAADSQHGLHGKEMNVEVSPDMTVEISSRPMVAKHTRLVVGISILFGVFGLLSLFRSRSGSKAKP